MQTLNIPVILGPAFAGIELKAQLFDDDGINVGATVTDGFSQIGEGNYLFHYEEYPDGFTGGVKFLKLDNTFLAATAINPSDFAVSSDLSALINASILHSGTLSDASGGTTVFLDEGAASQTGFYNDCWIVFTGGAGIGQVRPVAGYTGDTRAVEMEFGLSVAVDETTQFAIIPASRVPLTNSSLSAIANSVWQAAASDFTDDGIMGTLLSLIAARVAAANITVVNPIAANKFITIIQGDSYFAEDSRGLDFSSAAWPDLTDAEIKFTANADEADPLEVDGSVVTPTGTKVVRVELANEDTESLVVGNSAYKYDIQATLSNGHIVTLVRGEMTVLSQQSTS